MIPHITRKKTRPLMGLAVILILLLGLTLRPAVADDKSAALKAIQAWTTLIDRGEYDQSWQTSSQEFQKALSSKEWQKALNDVRKPLGNVKERELASAALFPPASGKEGRAVKQTHVIAQYHTAFENLADAVETITFFQEKDGSWRAAGYYIKPRL